jgi:hypothetical protein
MEKPYIFLDFDGLQFNTLPALIIFFNETYKINSVAADYISGSSLQSIIRKYDPGNTTSFDDIYLHHAKNFLASLDWHKNVLPVTGMCEVVPRLVEKYTLWTLTARQNISLPVIRYLSNKYVPNCISGVHCVWSHINGEYRQASKKTFIESVVGEKIAFIDDSKSEIIKMGDTIPSYLFDLPGLHRSDPEIKYHLDDWEEVEKTFL